MSQNLQGKKLGIIHAALITTRAVQKYLDEVIPEVEVVHWVDDTIQNTNFACAPGTIPPENYAKFTQAALSQQAYGVDLILLACSTFNRAVEHARPMIATPMLQIDRPMMDLAVRHGTRIGLLATVPTTVPASERLLRLAATDACKTIEIRTRLCSEAFAALKAGRYPEAISGFQLGVGVRTDFVKGIAMVNERMLILLDIEQLVDDGMRASTDAAA